MLHKPTFSAKTQLDEDSMGPGFLPNNNPISRGCTPKVKHLKMSYSMEQQKMVKSHKVNDNTEAFFFKDRRNVTSQVDTRYLLLYLLLPLLHMSVTLEVPPLVLKTWINRHICLKQVV